MKVVHINKKNPELERAIDRLGNEVAEKRAKLEMKRFLRLKAEPEAKQDQYSN